MNSEMKIKRVEPIYQKSWLMWILLILLPPIGVLILWLQKKHSLVKKIALTIIASIYFIIIFIWNPTIPLYQGHEDFIKVFNQKVDEQKLDYQIQITKEDASLISSEISEDISLIESLETDGSVQELILIGQGAGTDVIHVIGVLIEATNPDLKQQEVGEVLKELHLFDSSFQFNNNDATVEKEKIRYNLKYDEETGVVFSVSHIN